MEKPVKKKRPRIKYKPTKQVEIKSYEISASDLLCVMYRVKNNIKD